MFDLGPVSASIPDFLRLLAVPVFVYAAWRDIQTRRVANRTWYPLLALAALLLVWDGVLAAGEGPFALNRYLVSALVSVFVVIPLSLLFYRLGGYGGADMKAIAVLALLFPAYPSYLLSGVPTLPVIGQVPATLPEYRATIGVFSFTLLSNAVLFGALYPLALTTYNLVRGRFSPAMLVGVPVPVERLSEMHGRLLELADDDSALGSDRLRGYTTSGLDIDALRMYLRWRGTTIAAIRADPGGHRDPRSIPHRTSRPGDGAVDDGPPVGGFDAATDGGRSDEDRARDEDDGDDPPGFDVSGIASDIERAREADAEPEDGDDGTDDPDGVAGWRPDDWAVGSTERSAGPTDTEGTTTDAVDDPIDGRLFASDEPDTDEESDADRKPVADDGPTVDGESDAEGERTTDDPTDGSTDPSGEDDATGDSDHVGGTVPRGSWRTVDIATVGPLHVPYADEPVTARADDDDGAEAGVGDRERDDGVDEPAAVSRGGPDRQAHGHAGRFDGRSAPDTPAPLGGETEHPVPGPTVPAADATPGTDSPAIGPTDTLGVGRAEVTPATDAEPITPDALDVDEWGADRFLREVGRAYGTDADTLRGGLEVVARRDSVWVSPGIPFMIPILLGLLAALTVGDLLFAILSIVGIA